MKKAFYRLNKGLKIMAKYFVFSALFVLAGVLSTQVSAIAPNKDGYSQYDDYSADPKETNINGVLNNLCANDKYSIIKGSYYSDKGNNGCVSYVSPSFNPIYYVQGRGDTVFENSETWNIITFTIKASKAYPFVIANEDNYSSSNPEAKDYDLYTLKGDVYEYENITFRTTPDGHEHTASGASIKYENGTYTFSYRIREATFTSHTIYIYLYEAYPEGNNHSIEIPVKFTLAKPISDYTYKVDMKEANQSGEASKCNLSNSEVCISYNKHGLPSTLKDNTFTITFNQDAAFYFSTVVTHGYLTNAIDKDLVNAFNSIYATNTFYNQDDLTFANPIVYQYYDFKDHTLYRDNISYTNQKTITASDEGYNLTLTIDAMGTYRFYITDIFGNTLNPLVEGNPEVDDVSNRTLTIYYIIYELDKKGDPIFSNSKHSIANFGDNVEKMVLDYQLDYRDVNIDDVVDKLGLNKLTNKNITIGLEFYSKIDVRPDFAIGTAGKILQNPLSYNNDSTNEVRISDSGKNYTYFCRVLNNSDECITDINQSRYIEQPLLGIQSIAGDTRTGLNEVNNAFATTDSGVGPYFNGELGGLEGTQSYISRAIRNNKTQIVLNENGTYKVVLQDVYGNSVTSTINVSIIDQSKPIVKLDAPNAPSDAIDNYICSNMYVIGGGIGDGNNGVNSISTYPNHKLGPDDCKKINAIYDNYKEADTTPGAAKNILDRKDNRTANTLGFYNIYSNQVRFTYADAIRIGLLRASDNIVKGANYEANSNKNLIEKSIYETTKQDYTEYATYSLNRDLSNKINITGNSNNRVNYGYELNQEGSSFVKNDLVIENSFNQYSSELKAFNDREFIKYEVYEINSNGTEEAIACDSVTDRNNGVCEDIVNAYIDKGMDFKLVFTAQDYAGNISLPATLVVHVFDNTTPGIKTLNQDTGLVENKDPLIYGDNLATKCRLEMGSKIQSKSQLMECYGFLKEEKYEFVDNFTNYFKYMVNDPDGVGLNYNSGDFDTIQTPNNTTDRVYKKTLSNQLFINGIYNKDFSNQDSAPINSYYNHIKVYVCTVPESTLIANGVASQTCSNTDSTDPNWKEVTETSDIRFTNAGNYKIKFVLTDTGYDYLTVKNAVEDLPSTKTNTTTIILCYYVNPRVLLVRPKMAEKKYGDANPNFGYCVYATTNTDSFFYNLFDIKSGVSYVDTYDFVRKNYESSEYGLVYCTSDDEVESGPYLRSDLAVLSDLNTVLASNDAKITGDVNYTYATGSNAYNMELDPTTTYNAYQDAGYYYMTMGNLAINSEYAANYIIRLHPSYLLDAQINGSKVTINSNLKNYNDPVFTNDDTYKYGINKESYGETISNVIYTINQTELKINAINGSKNYATPDTNFPQYYNSLASVNVHQFLNVNGETKNNSTAGYLNGFNVDGLINSETVQDFTHVDSTSGLHQYDKIISGYLKREMGEEAGVYRICNNLTNIDGLTHTLSEDLYKECVFQATAKEQYKPNEIELKIGQTGNVYKDFAGLEHVVNADQGRDPIRPGMFVKYGDNPAVKLTFDNLKLKGEQLYFVDNILNTVWKYRYDESDYSVKILANDNNQNQNYYITYTAAEYIINPSNIVIQPGSNQGKEYSNPQHNDPRFEIVIFGEQASVKTGGYPQSETGFNGFTTSIDQMTLPQAPTYKDYEYGEAPDTLVYFEQRRTTSHEKFAHSKFIYKYNLVDMDSSNNFIWQGQTYHFNTENNKVNICLQSSIVNGKYTQCQEGTIGVFKVEKADATNQVIITTPGLLTYQNYPLFASGETGEAGSGKITRKDPNLFNVGWYDYVFTPSELHAVFNSKSVCDNANLNYVFSINPDRATRGTSRCVNYNIKFDASAPQKIVDKDEYLTVENNPSASGYLHDGLHYCGNPDDGNYSYSCQGTGYGQEPDSVGNIKFFIFKRDIIISFNLFSFVYENLYDFFDKGIFTIPLSQSTVPTYLKEGQMEPSPILTCYKKDPAGAFIASNGNTYSPLTYQECNGKDADNDYGISSSDTWGPDGQVGLNLKFYLADYLRNNFNKEHSLPGGLYYVYATIGDWSITDGTMNPGIHPNYNLVYIDYNKLVAGKNDPDQKDGALEITSRPVDITGTYYQKEFGQAQYNTYGNTGTSLVTTNVGKGQYNSVLNNVKKDNKIFDNHYYHCQLDTENTLYNGKNVVMGKNCYIESDGIVTNHEEYKSDTNYGYSNPNNVFLYTISKVDGKDKTGIVDGNSSGKLTDQISTNFIGTPKREQFNSKDEYGLLDNVGFYKIDLTDITPALTNYRNVNNELIFNNKTINDTLFRYTNYSINKKTSGGLYITPASIRINVTPDQTKMYGCAYNTLSTKTSLVYKYGVGYQECVESNGQYFDLGYQYVVNNDKYNWLKSKVDVQGNVYPEFKACANLTDRDKNSFNNCTDIDYSSSLITSNNNYIYTVTPNYNDVSIGNNKPVNTALNTGTLFRMPATSANKDVSNGLTINYDYKTYFDYASKAQKEVSSKDRVYQNQNVGDYFITLGNLDSKYNGVNVCNQSGSPLSDGQQHYGCKNFVINYYENNTAGHTKNASTNIDSFIHYDADIIKDGATFDLTEKYIKNNVSNEQEGNNTGLIFKIFNRDVVIHSEYNYKVFGDTEPNEGFTCNDLKAMYPGLNFKGRDYCNSPDGYIKTGVTRFYAANNSLAKAPWTNWTKETNDNDPTTSFNYYEDILFDVIDPTSQINRSGKNQGLTNANANDPSGIYYYIYDIKLNTTGNNSNGSNYNITYINKVDEDVSKDNYSVAPKQDNLVYGANYGFAHIDQKDKYFRWYQDTNHACYSVAGVGNCDKYTGTETYNFHVNNIKKNVGMEPKSMENNLFTAGDGHIKSEIVNRVFFEIVNREIYMQTTPVVKDYGIEENYLDYGLKLVTPKNPANLKEGYKDISISSKWGDVYSLSKNDYDKFYPQGVFSLSAFTGSNEPSSYRGNSTSENRAFGIYYYRTRGEEIGQYTIVACASQKDKDMNCQKVYNDLDTEEGRQAEIHTFIPENSSNEYNASNYIIHTIPSTITIKTRGLFITPDSKQSFMYGNYETGKMLPPITYTESYTKTGSQAAKNDSKGLVNGAILDISDNVKNQVAYCIYDISGRITCINDRQNTMGLPMESIKYVTTGLHNGGNTQTSNIKPTYDPSQNFINEFYKPQTDYLNHNVYNDEYIEDNDGSRNALDRIIKGDVDRNSQRYNRNVGTYVIVSGDLLKDRPGLSCTGSTGVNCVDRNYVVTGFSENVEYTITPATVVVTPKVEQSKIYGNVDPQIKFEVTTKFEYQDLPLDDYYCVANKGACQYSNAESTYKFNNETKTEVVVDKKIVYLNGFAYDENVMLETNINPDFNYGIAKVGNKLASQASQSVITNNQPLSDDLRPKNYDKYCYNNRATNEECSNYTYEHNFASVKYGTTDRILLGYFYVENWDQRAGIHNILNGIMVADNEFGTPNYLYKTLDGEDVSIGMDTTVDFTINQLDIDATMPNVEDSKLNPDGDLTLSIVKTYGQATDSHKADAFTHECIEGTTKTNCIKDHAKLFAKNNENRLEYNFNVTSEGSVNDVVLGEGKEDLVVLTPEYNGHYYTQTGIRETKNIHLGLSVIRKKTDGNACLANDPYGCEDVGSYVLSFRKEDVSDNVDDNYNITYGGAKRSISIDNSHEYISVESTTINFEQKEGIHASDHTSASYLVYANNKEYLDVAINDASANINVVDGYTMKFEIRKRFVTFYVGTYESDGRVAERYIIEQNEQVPEFPELYVNFTVSSDSQFPSKKIYNNTWFDTKEYNQNDSNTVPRQVRTQDNLRTNLTEGSPSKKDKYGVGICKIPVDDIQSVVYGDNNCQNFVQYYQTNLIDENEKYYFDTSVIGDYAIVRNHASTYITYGNQDLTYEYEAKNYDVKDVNGTLVIYEDKTAPIITAGNENFPIEANANKVLNDIICSVNEIGKGFSYNCSVEGKLFDEGNKTLGDIISYIANNYSGYNSETNKNADNGNRVLPSKFPDSAQMETWVYQPVNNIGNADSLTTLYKKDRTLNTYSFAPNQEKISTRLGAISSIVSWFNINSYDYSFIRNNHYVTKRYTPRYYFYIASENGKGNVFDPTYVGDFTITVYAMDNVGNQSSIDLTLQIVDTTKPVISEMHLFNNQVVCKGSPCVSNNISDWFVDDVTNNGYVPINAFRKYDLDGTANDTNGLYIKLNGKTVNYLDPSQVTRYTLLEDIYKPSIVGEYVKVEHNKTPAIEVEHMSWFNKSNLYLVVVGGKDNSYIDPQTTDSESQWNTYYTFDDATSWYKYDRHASSGTAINFVDGVSKIYTKVIDTGRKFTQTKDGTHFFYNNIYLARKSSDSSVQNVCNALGEGCTVIKDGNEQDKTITQIIDLTMKPVANKNDEFTFKINGTTITYNSTSHTVNWEGLNTSKDVIDGQFNFGGLMTCDISLDNKVSCSSEYYMLYKAAEKKSIDKIKYTVVDSKNIGDADLGDAKNRFYFDRRYVLIDTKAPTIEILNGNPYSVYEYTNKCDINTKGGENESCYESYREKFLMSKDEYGVSSVNSNNTNGDSFDPGFSGDPINEKVLIYIGNGVYDEYNALADNHQSVKNNYSGLLKNDTNVIGGSSKYDNKDQQGVVIASDLNRFDTNITVYLSILDAGVYTYYKYTTVFDGTKYYVLRQELSNQVTPPKSTNYDLMTGYNLDIAPERGLTTIESLLEFIVSTESIPQNKVGSYLDFSINYNIKDAAGNISTNVKNLTVRGITYVNYSSTIQTKNALNPNVFVNKGNNSYIVDINQGVNFNTILDNFELTNINYKGENNISNLKQSIYYNGESLIENEDYSDSVISYLNNIACAPGQYTLKITNTREMETHGEIKQIVDRPLTITFNVTPGVATTNSANNSTYTLIGLICMILSLFSVLCVGILLRKKHSK